MANVFDVADLLIQLANQSEDDHISNLKLNKLLYYANGAFLSRTGRPLFPEQFEAWQLGPVIPAVYRKYRQHDRNPIPWDGEDVDISRFAKDELDAIFDVVREFGQYTGSALVSMTHLAGTPWSDVYDESAIPSRTISNQSIKEYFVAHPVPTLMERIKPERVTSLPNDWYDPDEDAEWEAYLA